MLETAITAPMVRKGSQIYASSITTPPVMSRMFLNLLAFFADISHHPFSRKYRFKHIMADAIPMNR